MTNHRHFIRLVNILEKIESFVQVYLHNIYKYIYVSIHYHTYVYIYKEDQLLASIEQLEEQEAKTDPIGIYVYMCV